MKIESFADKHGLQIVIRRYPKQKNRWTAQFDGCEIKSGNFLSHIYGDANTIDGAINNYLVIISGKLLVQNAYQKNRKEIKVPKTITNNI